MNWQFSPALIALFALILLIIPVSAVATGISTIGQGGEVFIGEEGIDISRCTANATRLAWFGSGTSPSADVPDYILEVGNPGNFYVSPSIFGERKGLWYQWSGSPPAGFPAFNVIDPSLETGIISQGTGNTVSYGDVPQGDFLNFYISSNMWTVSARPGYDPSKDGIFSIKVTSPDGITYTALYQNSTYAIPLTGVSVNSTYVTWVPAPPPYNEMGWNTGIADPSGTLLYKPGTYEVTVETELNGMKDNYRDPDGTEYIGKTVAYPQPVTIGSDTIAITVNKASVVRGNQFSVTLRGMPGTVYIVWVKNTGHMTGLAQDQPPTLLPSQSGLRSDPAGGPYQFGGYQFQGGGGRTVLEDVPYSPANGTLYYGRVSLSTTGSRTIQWQTTSGTKDRTYTFRAERGPPGPNGLPDIFSTVTKYSSAEVDAIIGKGAVTIIAEGEQSSPVSLEAAPGVVSETISVPSTSLPTTLSPPIREATPSPSPTPSPPSPLIPNTAIGLDFWLALTGIVLVAFLVIRRS
jgi:hypothetical protein